MKEHNTLVKFKNRFLSDPAKLQQLTPIISEDLSGTVGEKLKGIGQIYRSQIAENGYSEALAYRVIVLNLMFPKEEGFDIKEEIDRFFRHCLGSGQLEKMQLCFDLLLLKELQQALPGEHVRVLKVRMLVGLRQYYGGSGARREQRRCGRTLEAFCKQSLCKEEVKRRTELYCEVLDALISQVKRRVSLAVSKGKRVDASQQLSIFTQFLEKSEQVSNSKYQKQLLEAYWSLSLLHEQLHYLAFSRKYAGIALNIALRLDLPSSAAQIQRLLTPF